MSGSMNWRERYRQYERKAFNASRVETTPERTAAFDECQKMFEDLMSDPDRPISESDSLQITSIKQLLAWCDRAQTDELFPFHIRQVRDAAEKLGIRVKLPVLPMEAEFLNGRNQELMDRWKNIVTEFIESIKRSLEKSCTDDPILDNEVKKGVDATDTKTDRKNKSNKKRHITQEAVKCGEYVRRAFLLDPTNTRKMAVQEYVDENGGSAASLDRRLGDNKQLYEPN